MGSQVGAWEPAKILTLWGIMKNVNLENTQEALQAYRRATQLDPGNADGWNMSGLLLARVGDLTEAMAAYNTVLALGEQHSNKLEIAAAYSNLGNVYQTRGDLDKAIEFYQKALKLHEALGSKGGMAANYGNLGLVYQMRGDLGLAIEFFQKALKLMEGRFQCPSATRLSLSAQ